MIGQYLPQTNESVTVAKSKIFSHVNKALNHRIARAKDMQMQEQAVEPLADNRSEELPSDRDQANG